MINLEERYASVYKYDVRFRSEYEEFTEALSTCCVSRKRRKMIQDKLWQIEIVKGKLEKIQCKLNDLRKQDSDVSRMMTECVELAEDSLIADRTKYLWRLKKNRRQGMPILDFPD